MEEVINEDLVDHDNDAAIAAALAANAVIPQQPSRRREGDRHPGERHHQIFQTRGYSERFNHLQAPK